MREKSWLGRGSGWATYVLLGALFALTVAGCGQPPPSNDG